MKQTDLEKILLYIVSESVKLKNTYTDEIKAPVEFADIFSKDSNEYQQLTEAISGIDHIPHPTPTGTIYNLKKPIKTLAGDLFWVKIRKPDNTLRFRGDADFNTDYQKLKQQYQHKPNFEFIIRETFEMLRLSDLDFDVMTCFSNIPVRTWI